LFPTDVALGTLAYYKLYDSLAENVVLPRGYRLNQNPQKMTLACLWEWLTVKKKET